MTVFSCPKCREETFERKEPDRKAEVLAHLHEELGYEPP